MGHSFRSLVCGSVSGGRGESGVDAVVRMAIRARIIVDRGRRIAACRHDEAGDTLEIACGTGIDPIEFGVGENDCLRGKSPGIGQIILGFGAEGVAGSKSHRHQYAQPEAFCPPPHRHLVPHAPWSILERCQSGPIGCGYDVTAVTSCSGFRKWLSQADEQPARP